MANGNGTGKWIALIVTSAIAVGTTMWGINGSLRADTVHATDERSRENAATIQVFETKLDNMADDIREIKEAVK